MKENDYTQALIKNLEIIYQENNLEISSNLKTLAFLNSIDEKSTNYLQSINTFQSEFTTNNVENIRNQYNDFENIKKDIAAFEKKQQTFINNIAILKDTYTKKISKEFHTLSKSFELQIEKLIENQEAPVKLLKTNYNRAKNTINKEISKANELYENEVSLIFNLKNERLESNKTNFEANTSLLSTQYRTFLNEKTSVLNQFVKEKQKQVSANDTNYVSIKKTHNLQNEYLNKIVNSSKRNFAHIKLDLETKLNEKIDLINNTYNDIKEKHQKSLIQEHNRYEQKLNALNVVFDVQKSSFNQNKKKLTKEKLDSITLLNSKLSSNKDSILNEKKSLKKQLFSNSKKATEDERKDLEYEYNKALKQLDLNLEKQIKRTSKDILKYEKDYQRALYELEEKHIKQINKWRVTRLIYDQEHKLFMQSLEQKLNIINKNHDLDLEHTKSNNQNLLNKLELQVSIDLLPIETQSLLSSALSEREINLLSNETQIYLQEKSLDEHVLKSEIEIERLKSDYTINFLTAQYEYNEQKTIIESQLDQGLSKIKRDSSLNILNQKLILERINVDRGNNLKVYQNNIYTLTSQYLRDYNKILATKQIESLRFSLTNENINKRHELIQAHQNEQTDKNIIKIDTYLTSNLLRYNKDKNILINFYENIFNYYYVIDKLSILIEDYFNLPVTPEVLREVLLKFNDFVSKYLVNINELIENYKTLILNDLDELIETFSGYKYMIKHEDVLSDYSNKENVILDELSINDKKIFKYQQQLKNIENNIIKLNQMIQKAKTVKKEDRRIQLKNYSQGISNAKKQAKRTEENLYKLLKTNNLYKDELVSLKKTKDTQEEILNSDKKRELSDLYRFKNDITKLTSSLTKLTTSIANVEFDYYMELANPNNIYLTIDKFNNFSIKHKKALNKKHSKIHNLYSSFFDFHYFKYTYFNENQNTLKTNIINSSINISSKLNTELENDLDSSLITFEQKRLEFEKQMEILNINYSKNKEVELAKYIEKNNILDSSLLKTEEQIQFYENDLIKQQNVLRVNLNGVIDDLNVELTNKLKHAKAANESKSRKILKQITHSKDTFLVTKESNKRKHKALLDRYRVTHEKALLTKIKKEKELETQLKRTQSNYDKLIKHDLLVLEGLENRHKSFINKHEKTLKDFDRDATYQQKYILRKELKQLRKSYFFKINELNLK